MDHANGYARSLKEHTEHGPVIAPENAAQLGIIRVKMDSGGHTPGAVRLPHQSAKGTSVVSEKTKKVG